jgi:hypothetical protein
MSQPIKSHFVFSGMGNHIFGNRMRNNVVRISCIRKSEIRVLLFFFNSVQFNKSILFLYEDGHGNIVKENGAPEPMDCIVDQNEFIVKTIATYIDYLKDAATCKSSPTCPMLIEKSKDKDTHVEETNTRWDYVRYTVQYKARFFRSED